MNLGLLILNCSLQKQKKSKHYQLGYTDVMTMNIGEFEVMFVTHMGSMGRWYHIYMHLFQGKSNQTAKSIA